MTKNKAGLAYIISDFVASAIAWSLFYVFRRMYIEPLKYGYEVDIFYFDTNYFLAVILIPLMWVLLFSIFGSYRNIYRKSRFKELGQTLSLVFMGTVILFFSLLLNDEVYSYKAYPLTFTVLFALLFTFIFGFRLIWLTTIKNKLKSRIIGFNTLLVGSNQKALNLYNELESSRYSQGYRILGYVNIGNEQPSVLRAFLPHIGNYRQLPRLIKDYAAEEVIIAMETSEHETLSEILSYVEGEEINVKVIPDMYDIISGTVRLNYIFGTALIEVMPEIMPVWQQNIKRIMDIGLSFLVLT
ncbi:MAG: sugar transferase, partial [Bacteroidota bacterium]|nr:sugar transferase [Bacteroidota bacterium]